MPRSGGGVYSLPAGSIVTDGVDDILASQHNDPLNDLALDMNTARPIVAGGTGATTASAARTALGLAIGSDVQAYDAELAAIAGLTSAADKVPYFTGSGTAAVADLSSYGRTLIANANAADARADLGLVIGTDIQAYGATLTSLESLSLVAGDVLYATAADTLARLAKGTAGQVLRMNAGATAPEWVTPSRVLLATKTASASATLDFTEFDNAKYRRYEFELENVKPATDITDLYFRVSTDGGSSYNAGASDYSWSYGGTGDAVLTGQDQADAQIRLTENTGNAAQEDGVSGDVLLINAPSATLRSRMVSKLTFDNSSGVNYSLDGSGVRLADQDTDAVRFLYSSGNISSGTIRMFGIV